MTKPNRRRHATRHRRQPRTHHERRENNRRQRAADITSLATGAAEYATLAVTVARQSARWSMVSTFGFMLMLVTNAALLVWR